MDCDDMIGDWNEGLLVDSAGEFSFDSPLNIFNDGELKGRFAGDHNAFKITCQVIAGGSRLKVEFTRVHNDGKTTTYKGTVVSFEPRASLGIIRGTFDRPNRADEGLAANGDWETEKPT